MHVPGPNCLKVLESTEKSDFCCSFYSLPDAFTGSYGAHVAVVIAVVLAAIFLCLVLVCFCSFLSKRMKKKRSGAALCGSGGFGLKKNTGYFKVLQ